jgi:hypothetical protein
VRYRRRLLSLVVPVGGTIALHRLLGAGEVDESVLHIRANEFDA